LSMMFEQPCGLSGHLPPLEQFPIGLMVSDLRGLIATFGGATSKVLMPATPRTNWNPL
jgi:hypothetical protein